MSLKENKGAISIFVLVALLFIAAFLIISYANNVNKSKVIGDQFNIINDIYTGSENDESAYEKVYSALRSNNQRTLTSYSEKSPRNNKIIRRKFKQLQNIWQCRRSRKRNKRKCRECL